MATMREQRVVAAPPTYWERMLAKYGLATVLAVAFFWWLTSDVSGVMRETNATLKDHVRDSNFYLRQLCLNTAQTDAARAGCIPPEQHRLREEGR
jgi:hypothetical protein